MKWKIALLCSLLFNAFAVNVNDVLVYECNYNSDKISIIDITTNTVTGYVNPEMNNIANPIAIGFTIDMSKAYVVCDVSSSVHIINPVASAFTGPVTTGAYPFSNPAFIAFSPDGTKAYVTNYDGNSMAQNYISIIDTATDTVTGYVNPNGHAFSNPYQVQFSPDGTKAYVTNFTGNTVSIIDAMTDTVTGYVTGSFNAPFGVIFISNTKAYVTNNGGTTVSIINVSTATVSGSVTTGSYPFSNPQNIGISSDNTIVAVQNQSTNQISLVNTTTDTAYTYVSGTFNQPSAFGIGTGNTIMYISNRGGNAVDIVDLTTTPPTLVSSVNDTNYPFSGPIAGAFAFSIVSGPQKPTHLQGFKKKNIFLSQTDLINLITWSPPTGDAVPVSYNVYRGPNLTDLAANVPASGRLQFVDHDRQKGVTYNYYVASVDENGLISVPVHISITR